MRQMKVSLALIGFALLTGCGRTSHDADVPAQNSSAGAAAGGSDASPPGLGPIDASGEPAALPMTCEGRAESLAFKLPCLIGQNLTGNTDEPGYHVVECELAGEPNQTAVSFTIPLKQLPELLNQPVSIPFDGLPASPPSSGVELDGVRFAGSLSGVVTFTQVDVDGRAFVANLERGHVMWIGDQGTSFGCSTIDGPFWAVGAWFI